jgi:hypothetical protein
MKVVLLPFAISCLLGASVVAVAQERNSPASQPVETKYDVARDETTVRLPPIKVSGEKGKYHSLHAIVWFKHPGSTRRVPEMLTFELVTVVKARRLKVDLYVQLLVDGEKIFLSSNRWAERNVVPGKPWVSEHIALRMPHDVFVKITKARDFAIQLDGLTFVVGDAELQVLRDFGASIAGKKLAAH